MANKVLATFTIRNLQGQRQSGYITQMLDVNGEHVTDPKAAKEFVGFIQEGEGAGNWIRFPADDDEYWTRIRMN